MQTAHTSDRHPGKSSVVFMPMIDMKPTDPSCILSTMKFVAKEAKDYGHTPILTFDQPLYWKALEIQMWEKDQEVNDIVLVLGQFHTSMSFLGSIGHLMSGSGLDAILKLVYADNVVPHMMNGKAVSRAIRGHLLVAASLYGLLVSQIYEVPILLEDADSLFPDLNNSSLQNISELFDNTVAGDANAISLEENLHLIDLQTKLHSIKESLNSSKTALLWFQYLEMVAILCKSTKAQRTGNWLLHLESISEMLPYFAASGHHFYAKSAYAYLQSMQDLETTNRGVFHHFKDGGMHVVRRSERYWAGISSDMIIEQVLMRSIKTSGGLTRGKGVGEVQRMVWLLSTPVCAAVNEAIQNLSGVTYVTSDQHKETTFYRRTRDYKDAITFIKYIIDRNPFHISNDLMSIETGEVSGAASNVHLAKEVGTKIIKNMEGKTFLDYSFTMKEKCQVMVNTSSVRIDENIVPVDPQLLFQRLLIALSRDSDIDLNDVFKYEMSTSPASLFSEKDGLMREADKPQLSLEIWDHIHGDESVCVVPSDTSYVLDGGCLLQKIQGWSKGQTFDSIFKLYTDYVARHYGIGTAVVFDGGYNKSSTKDTTHLRRTKFKKGKEVQFSKSMTLNIKKDDFLLNKNNKQHFLELLCEHFNNKGFVATQASGDAELDIVKAALRSSELQPTILIGEDTDLLMLLLYHSNDCHDIYFTSEKKSNMKKKTKLWDIAMVRKALGHDVCKRILLIHALLGCDTTSRIYGVNKASSFKQVFNDEEFCKNVDVFCSQVANTTDVINAGEKLLLVILGAKTEKSLDELRLMKFTRKIATSTNAVVPESLGPTSDAARFHSLRVYNQVQEWMGVTSIDAVDWGWMTRGDYLLPIRMSKPAAPSNLLKMIMCGCKGECQGRCTCFKYKLKCTAMCTICKGVSCLNCSQIIEEDEQVPNEGNM